MLCETGMGVDRFVVVTGGPGSGKTTLLEGLVRTGLVGTREAGRGVIEDQLAIGGSALPWADRELFAEQFRYHRRVLMAPPWPVIFEQDNERRQNLAEA